MVFESQNPWLQPGNAGLPTGPGAGSVYGGYPGSAQAPTDWSTPTTQAVPDQGAPPPGTPPPNDGGGGGGGGGGGSLSPSFNFAPTPEFTFKQFKAPTLVEAQNEPGYQFRLNSGTDALQKSAAARGVLRTGGTLKDLVQYGQNFAQQEYSNVFDRALKAYGTYYQGQRDAFDPQMAAWKLLSNAEIQRGMAQFGREGEREARTNDNAQREKDRNAPPPPQAPPVSPF